MGQSYVYVCSRSVGYANLIRSQQLSNVYFVDVSKDFAVNLCFENGIHTGLLYISVSIYLTIYFHCCYVEHRTINDSKVRKGGLDSFCVVKRI